MTSNSISGFFPSYTAAFVHPGVHMRQGLPALAGNQFEGAKLVAFHRLARESNGGVFDGGEVNRLAVRLLRDKLVSPLDEAVEGAQIGDRDSYETAVAMVPNFLKLNTPLLKNWRDDQFKEFFCQLNWTMLGEGHPRRTTPFGTYRTNNVMITKANVGINFNDIPNFGAFLLKNDPEAFPIYQSFMKDKWEKFEGLAHKVSYKTALERKFTPVF